MNIMSFKYFVGLSVLNAVYWQVSFGIPLQPHWGLSFTLVVPERKEDCYFLSNVRRKKNISIEFRVTNTKSVWAGKNVMIGFHVFDLIGGKIASVETSVARSFFLPLILMEIIKFVLITVSVLLEKRLFTCK